MSTKPAMSLLRLVQNNPSEDLIETLTWLLQEAAAGRITGMAYGVMMPGRAFVVDAVGEAQNDPLRGVGLSQYVAREITARHMGI